MAFPNWLRWLSRKHLSKEENRISDIEEVIWVRYFAGDYDQVEALATEWLELADRFRGEWFYGTAIHDANQLLGLVQLERGHESEAVAYLHRAAETPGGPSLNSYGPSPVLAEALILRGYAEDVIRYLEACMRFWLPDPEVAPPTGIMKLTAKGMADVRAAVLKVWPKWKLQIRRGRVPSGDIWEYRRSNRFVEAMEKASRENA